MMMRNRPPLRPELEAALRLAAAAFEALSPDEQEAVLRQQKAAWVKAEMSWPRDCPYR